MGGCRLWRAILAVSCVIGGTVAQVVRVEAQGAYQGWIRTNCDVTPPHPAGVVTQPNGGVVLYVVGRRTGLDTVAVDVRVNMAAGERVTLDLSTSLPAKWVRAPLPKDPLAWFGGVATIAGAPLHWGGLTPDGAGYTAHLHARTGPMLHTDLWVWWTPEQPGWCSGEVLVGANNPAVPDVLAEAPPGFDLRFGDAFAIVPGAGGSLLPAGTRFADGQARALPVTFVWPRHIKSARDFTNAVTASQLGVAAVGISKLWPDGNPTLPPGFDSRAWTAGKLAPCVLRLHTWDAPVIGPNKNSADTGAQSDQVFLGAQVLTEPFAAHVFYLSALKLAGKPIQRLEANGLPLRPEDHPGLRCWDGLVHWSVGASPDRLGKPRLPTLMERHDWHGPDVEHNFNNVLAIGARLTGSPASQRLLSNWARLYRSQWTTAAGLSTSSPYPSRATGWECLMAQHLWTNLEDRALAENIRTHHVQRLQLVIVPSWGTKEVRDIRRDDPRLGPGDWTMDWQNSIEEWFMDRSGAMFGVPEARGIALRAAKHTVANAFVFEGGRWICRPTRPLSGGGAAGPDFMHFGMPLSVATVLAHEPDHEPSRSIWLQMVADATSEKAAAWMPGVPQ